jgi:hypothetical protein
MSIHVSGGDQTCAEINRSTAFSYLEQGPTFWRHPSDNRSNEAQPEIP